MKKHIGIAVIIVLLAAVGIAYRLLDGWRVIEIAARLHSWGSTNCGHVTNSFYHGESTAADIAITCAQQSLERHRAFRVMFTGYGTDEEVSNALIVNSKGTAVEMFYASGMVNNRNKLLRHHCDVPTRFILEKDSPYGFPRLHCAEWPPKDLN